jgi:YVTN family beta-propeller protein
MAPLSRLRAPERGFAGAIPALRGLFLSISSFLSDGTPTLLFLAFLAIVVGSGSAAAQTGCVPNTLNYPCLYVANGGEGADDVSVMNATSNDLIAVAGVGVVPGPVAITPDNAFVYVAGSVDAKTFGVSIIDTRTSSTITTVSLQEIPSGIAITPDGKFAYVVEGICSDFPACDPPIIEVIDTANHKVVTEAQVDLAKGGARESGATAIAFTPTGESAYVADTCFSVGYTSCVEKVSTASHTVTSIITGGQPNEPASIAVNPDGIVCASFVDFNNGFNVAFISGVTLINPPVFIRDNAVTSNEGFTITPDFILYAAEHGSPDGSLIYNTVARVDTRHQQLLVLPVTVGNGPTGVAVGPGGASVYVTNSGDSTLSIINTQTDSVFTIQGVSPTDGVSFVTDSYPGGLSS